MSIVIAQRRPDHHSLWRTKNVPTNLNPVSRVILECFYAPCFKVSSFRTHCIGEILRAIDVGPNSQPSSIYKREYSHLAMFLFLPALAACLPFPLDPIAIVLMSLDIETELSSETKPSDVSLIADPFGSTCLFLYQKRWCGTSHALKLQKQKTRTNKLHPSPDSDTEAVLWKGWAFMIKLSDLISVCKVIIDSNDNGYPSKRSDTSR